MSKINYSETAYKNLNLIEGIDLINQFLIEVFKRKNLTVKCLSITLRIPLPVTVAIRNELIKAGAVNKGNYVTLTNDGKNFVEHALDYKGFNYVKWQQLLEDEVGFIKEIVDKYGIIYNERPTIDTTLDQAKCTAETSLKRAIYALKNNCLIGKKNVCLGDDDLLSVSISILIKEIFTKNEGHTEISVIEIDQRIIRYIKQVSEDYHFHIQFYNLDVRNAFPKKLNLRFNTVFTDPPYTLNGVRLFLSRAIEIMQNVEGQNIFLSIGHKDPVFNFEIQKMIQYMGLEIKELLKDFNKYEGAQIIGGRSQFLYLATMDKAISLVDPSFEEFMYTGQTLKTVRVFECVSCLTRYKVGTQQKVKTIESLKKASCDRCGHDKFKLIRRNKMD